MNVNRKKRLINSIYSNLLALSVTIQKLLPKEDKRLSYNGRIMRLLAYIYIFIVSGVSFGEIPQIVEHTRLVTSASEAKALYRVKVGEVDDETLEYKWFVDGVEQCQKSSCVIKAGKRIGKRRKDLFACYKP